MMRLVSARYSLDRLLQPARQRAVAAEYNQMRLIGEDLRGRVEKELGPDYCVTYHDG